MTDIYTEVRERTVFVTAGTLQGWQWLADNVDAADWRAGALVFPLAIAIHILAAAVASKLSWAPLAATRVARSELRIV